MPNRGFSCFPFPFYTAGKSEQRRVTRVNSVGTMATIATVTITITMVIEWNLSYSAQIRYGSINSFFLFPSHTHTHTHTHIHGTSIEKL